MSDIRPEKAALADISAEKPAGQAETWSARLDALMKAMDLNNAQLERRCGVGRKRIGEYRSGEAEPAATALHRIAKALGTTVEWLIEGEGDRPTAISGVAEPSHAFADPPRSEIVGMGERMRLAQLQLEEATQAVGVIPDEALRQVLYGLLFKHRIPVEDVAIILSAKARKVT
jgi:transcriptional regulator with XRE-family HTH domain